jgi:HEAT repeat protein
MKRVSALLCLFGFLFSAGCSFSSTENDLQKAIASRDSGAILRAFRHAIYDRSAKMSEALPAVKAHLHDADPWVRFLAAETLYTAGDQSGFATLVELVKSAERIPEPLEGSKEDLRLQAARCLVKFRQKKAALSYLLNLYKRTDDGYILHGIVSLLKKETPTEVIEIISKETKSNPQFCIFNLSLAQAPGIQRDAEQLFRDPKVETTYQEEARLLGAWALARLTGEIGYVQYLVAAAEPAIDGRQKANGYNLNTKALRYLGSIPHPLAREALERALNSHNSFALEIAVVNLLFNQPGGSEKARQVVLHQLKGLPLVMESWERTLQIAAKLGDPEMRAAGEAFDRRSGDTFWREAGVERKDWPIYNWIDDYVVELTEH